MAFIAPSYQMGIGYVLTIHSTPHGNDTGTVRKVRIC